MRVARLFPLILILSGLFVLPPIPIYGNEALPNCRNFGSSKTLATPAGTPAKTSHRTSIYSDKMQFLGQSLDSLPPIRMESEESYRSSYWTEGDGLDSPTLRGQAWTWQLFPDGVLYPAYLAGVNESRLGAIFNYDKDLHWIWDITLGGRAPLLRYGNRSAIFPEGFQVDVEGSVHLRLDFENDMDMDANDFRAGLPFTWGTGNWQFKTGYYHVSSHMGDERMIRLNAQGKPHLRINYVREAWIFGLAYKPTPSTRLYAEADFAFSTGEGTKPWHFQFGAEYSPKFPTNGFRGTPFAAVNLLLLQEHDYDGSINVQIGWQWRGSRNQIFRAGFQYFGGVSEQYEHIYAQREHKFGFGIWYDF